MPRLLWVSIWVLLPAAQGSALDIEWVTVGDPGNVCDVQPQGCFGSVGVEYRISKHEVTNAQYVEFLNAVAADDVNGLYSIDMTNDYRGGITRQGLPGSFTYSAKQGFESKPVVFVNFWDAARFSNWLHNGQPSGTQNASTTEDGAYSLSAVAITANDVDRNSGALFFVPSEDEWYKAGLYDPLATSFLSYPTGPMPPTCSAPSGGANAANCGNIVGNLTDVGSYSGSSSAYGTFDQGGNVWEWTEGVADGELGRVIRQGDMSDDVSLLSASFRLDTLAHDHSAELGIRIASVIPEPSTAALLGLGLAGLACRRQSVFHEGLNESG